MSRRLLALTGGHRAQLGLVVGLGLAITATYAGQALLVAGVLRRVLDGGAVGEIWIALVAVVALQAVRAAATWARESLATATAAAIKDTVRERLVSKLLELGPGYVAGGRTGDVQSTIVDGVETLEPYFASFAPQVLVSLVGGAALSAYVLFLDPVVGAVVSGCALVVPIAPHVSGRLLESRMTRWFARYRGMYSDSLDAIQGMTTLKALNAQVLHGARLAERSRDFARASTRLVSAAAAYQAVVGMAVAVGTSVAVGIGALRLAGGELELPALLAILLLARECFRPLTELGEAFHEAYPALATAPAIFALLDARPDVEDAAAARHPTEPSLRFDGVTFSYGPGRASALDAFSLAVAPGETVALVGRSGAGKSTVVSLLLRFFDPQAGTITVGGVPLAEIELERLRAMIAVVWQETYLFNGSVRDNLEVGRPGAGDAELERAARDAGVHDVIAALPDGYDTILGERGSRLSGGERQRIAIARALLRDAPILVLDEATASVDAAREASVQAALARLTAGRTTLVIAHRLSSVRDCDRVVVLDSGRVVEAGAPAELVARGGHFSRLVAAQ